MYVKYNVCGFPAKHFANKFPCPNGADVLKAMNMFDYTPKQLITTTICTCIYLWNTLTSKCAIVAPPPSAPSVVEVEPPVTPGELMPEEEDDVVANDAEDSNKDCAVKGGVHLSPDKINQAEGGGRYI